MVEGSPPEQSSVEPEQDQKRRRSPLFRTAQLLTVLVVVGMLALLVWRVVAANRGAELVKAISAGRRPPAPAFTLPVIWTNSPTWPLPLQQLLTLPQLPLRQLRGRPVVLNFWASWCIPCKEEAPRLNAAAQAHAGTVVFLGVDVQDLITDARRFLRHHGVRYASVHDNAGSTYDGYGLTGVPRRIGSIGVAASSRTLQDPFSRAQLESGIGGASK